MSNLMPSDIRDDVAAVLEQARKAGGPAGPYLTAYQILAMLPQPLRNVLLQQRGLPGSGAGVHYSAASLVSDAAELLPNVQKSCLDSRHVHFIIDGHPPIEAGYGVGLYRLPQ